MRAILWSGDSWPPANGVTNIDDGFAVSQTWKGNAGAPGLARSDVAPQEPNRVVIFNHVLLALFAFQGEPYPFVVPKMPARTTSRIPVRSASAPA